jgi:hypothetical protein
MPTRLSLPVVLVLVCAALLWQTLAAAAQDTTCTNAATLADKEVPDADAPLAPGEAFTVVWELENTGDCTWTRGYRLLPVDGDRMGGRARYLVTANVRPGRNTTFTLELAAPETPGFHQSIWRLSDAADGVPFGPWLAIEVQVAEADAATAADDVILPEVLAMGGRGGGGGDYYLDPCIVDGVDYTEPTLIWESTPTDISRRAFGYLCGFPLDAEVTTTLTSPTGESFSQNDIASAGTIYPEEGDEYTRPLAYFSLAWPARAPSGRWLVTITGEDVVLTDVLDVPEATPTEFDEYPDLLTYPVSSIDPFAAAFGCGYAYTLGEQFIIAGVNLSRTTTLQLGVYQERDGYEFLMDAFRVTTDRRGEFTKLYTAAEPGSYYWLHIINQINPDAYLEGSEAYDPFQVYDDVSATGCYTVKADPDESPLYLAFTEGDLGVADVHTFSVFAGYSDRVYYGGGDCDTYGPTWWPGGEWLLYSSNCTLDTETSALFPAADYDLYAYQVFTWDSSGSSPITDTPDVDETEPDVAPDGRIVYRRTPAGAPLADDGELWVLSADGSEDAPLGISGRVPAWSPDGTQIAYMSEAGDAWRIYVYDVASGESRLISEECPTLCRFPAWSPDGAWLLYNTTVSETNFRGTGLWSVPADGSAPPLRWLEGPYGHPAWSATGWIAFNGPDGIYRVHVDDNPPVPERYLFNVSDDDRPYASPVWSR